MDYQDYDDMPDDDTEENEENENQNTKERTKTKVKHKNRTKVKYKKSKPKKKIVYRDRTHTNGFLMFFLFLIILLLIAVIGYLVYVNYYQKDNKSTNNVSTNNTVKTTDNTPKMCESNTTVYTLDLGLNKCSSSNQFKLNVKGTPFSFTIDRNNSQYKIVNAFYDNTSIYPKIINVPFDSMKIKKIDDVYFIWIKGESEYLSGIYNGSVNYESNGYEYNIGSSITYNIYPNGEKKECSYYKENNLLDNTLYTKVKLNINNGNIMEDKTDVLVKDECS